MALLTLARDRVAIPEVAYNVLEARIDELRSSVLSEAKRRAQERQHGSANRNVELTQTDIEGALSDVAEGKVTRVKGPLPSINNDLNFWLDRRLYPIRAMVREQAVDLAVQCNQGNLTGEIMDRAWQLVTGTLSQRLPALSQTLQWSAGR
jgi:hypothetical protein